MEKNVFSLNQFSDEAYLLTLIASGDEAAFREIYDRYRNMVFAYAFKICSHQESAEDILLSVFLKIWQHPDASSITNLKAYLQTITRNATFNVLRDRDIEARAYRMISQTKTDEHNETDERILAADIKKIIDDAIKLLPPQQKLVYTLCKEDGLRHDEIAEKLSLSVLTVKTHLKLALRFLKEYLKEHDAACFQAIIFYMLLFY
ncbi:RNA polymerase sigma-70 factor [Chitinophagaceae bacterium 26-R-25]|nr:RNA polymerase sigma-70 factor [Chitinophagaceae bacterium 26-R-25]